MSIYSKFVAMLGMIVLSSASPNPFNLPAVAEDLRSAEADAMSDPGAFVGGLLDDLKAISAQADTERDTNLRATLLENMAVSRLQSYLIRGDIKASASEAELVEYSEIFPQYIAAAIGDSIDRMVDRRIEVGDVRENKRRAGDFIVRARVYSEEDEVRASLGWRVRKIEGRLLMTDFTVDGQSFTVERKAQFSVLVEKSGFSELLDHMRQTIEG